MKWRQLRKTGVCAACLVLLLSAHARGQSAANWPLAPEKLTLSFGPDNRQRRVTFDKDGVKIELEVHVLLVGRDRVQIETVLPDAGDLQMELARETLVKLVPADPVGGTPQAVLVSSAKAVSPRELAKRVQGEIDALLQPANEQGLKEFEVRGKRKVLAYLRAHNRYEPKKDEQLPAAFARAWAEENAPQSIRDQLQQIVDKYPKWLTDKETRGELLPVELLARFSEMRFCELADEHLIQCGCSLNKDDKNFRKRLDLRFEAVYMAMIGMGAEKLSTGVPATEVLSSNDRKNLRQSLTAELKCQLVLLADPDDANAQWFNAQRIACSAAGPVVRVEGRLTPADHDRVDWWRLDRWKQSQTTLDLPKLTSVRWEQYPIEGALLLRVVATRQEPTEYQFELRPAGKSNADAAITIFETSPPGGAKFPY